MDYDKWAYAVYTGGAIPIELWNIFIQAWDGDVTKLPDGILEIQFLDKEGLMKTFKKEIK